MPTHLITHKFAKNNDRFSTASSQEPWALYLSYIDDWYDIFDTNYLRYVCEVCSTLRIYLYVAIAKKINFSIYLVCISL